MTGIFLSEFSKDSRIAPLVRFITTILAGVPSIAVGVFAYGVFIATTKQFSALGFSEKQTQYRKTAEYLKSEAWKFFQLAGSYG